MHFKMERAVRSLKLLPWQSLQMELKVHDDDAVVAAVKKHFNLYVSKLGDLGVPTFILKFLKAKVRLKQVKGPTLAS